MKTGIQYHIKIYIQYISEIESGKLYYIGKFVFFPLFCLQEAGKEDNRSINDVQNANINVLKWNNMKQ